VGRGGSKPAAGDGGRLQRQELFISYSRKDRAFLERFWTHLSPLETQYGLQRWDDSRIQPGDIWLEEIERALARAQVALLLVSPDFLASDFIRRKELPCLFEAAQNDGLKILWVPLLPCSWKRFRQIEQYQAVIPVNPTLAEMGEVERDRAMVGITDHIHDLLEQIQAERLAAQEAAEAEAFARQQEEARRIAEQKSNRQAAETALHERLQAEGEARAEAERWKAEAQKSRADAERTRAAMERLAREKQEWQQQAVLNTPQPTAQCEVSEAKGPALIQISTTAGWVVREGNQWQLKEKSITVYGYQEQLAENIAITMIKIPAGEFQMGSPELEVDRQSYEGPQHLVKLGSFFLGQTAVTQAQWQVVAGWPKQQLELKDKPSYFQGANRPVEQVSWEEAEEFCRRLSVRTCRNYTLPSEAQWEYSCRAGTTTPFSFGETLTPDLSNYDGNYTYASGPKGVDRIRTSEVDSFPANGWGLHDMHGNVWEWCLDLWHATYKGAPADGRAWMLGGGPHRLLRGGSWSDGPRDCRSACRNYIYPAYRNNLHSDLRFSFFGFRVCCLPQD
jgi:formylglycine-generating enzyme required for sulfatase activity